MHNTKMISCGDDHTMRIWDIQSAQLIRAVPDDDRIPFNDMRFQYRYLYKCIDH